MRTNIYLEFILTLWWACTAMASVGDRSEIYLDCLGRCTSANCSSRNAISLFEREQPIALRLLRWDCVDECKYTCMWVTVDWFVAMKYRLPQFYGKWPFVRLLGMQEPASVLFSVLNGLVHYWQWNKYSRIVSNKHHIYYLHLGHAMVSINAWVWSTIFHSRDTWFTEVMDYLSALLAVAYSTFGLLVRSFDANITWKTIAMGFACISIYLNHVKYLVFENFDYGYNIKVAAATGVINLIGWLVWSALHYSKQPYVWKSAATALLVNILLALEIGDFPPIGYIFDAHSLWHFSTIPIHVLWYSFAIEDTVYLEGRKTS